MTLLQQFTCTHDGLPNSIVFRKFTLLGAFECATTGNRMYALRENFLQPLAQRLSPIDYGPEDGVRKIQDLGGS